MGDAGEYDVIVSSDYGSVTSQVARVIMSDNRPPALAAMADYTIDVLQTLVVTNLASDPDMTNHLTFALLAGAPTNATLNSTSGVFRWTPNRSQAPSTNVITVRVNDNGFPNLSDTRSFVVTVNDYVEITLGTVVALVGQSNSIPLEVFSSAPLVDVEILLELPTERFQGLALDSMLPDLVAASVIPTESTSSTQLKLTTLPGQVLQGTQQVARLSFIAVTNQISAFVPLTVAQVSMVTEPAGLEPALLANNNRVVIVAAQPLIEAIRNRSGVRQLILYGRTGATYTLQSKFAFGPGSANWVNRSVITMTNTSQTISASSQSQPLMYFRLMQ
jgi:hypothetical protein